jgi:hypothetical protein
MIFFSHATLESSGTFQNIMTDLREFEFIELNWHQLSNWKKSYVLKFDTEIIATLDHESIWKNQAIGKTAIGEWSIKISGIFKPEFTVRRKGKDKNLMQMSIYLHKSKSMLTFPSGKNYEWKKLGIMTNEFGWFYNDELIFDFNFVLSLTDKKRFKITFNKSNFCDEDLSLLLLIGTYFMINIQQYSAG